MMKDFFVFLTIIVSILVGTFMIVYFTAKYDCEAKLSAQQLEGTWGFWTDCMVKLPDGKMVPLSAYNTQMAIERGTKEIK